LAFITALYRFTVANNLPFLVLYSWTGLWTSLLLALISIFNLSSLIKFCTRFTDDCFNALLALNFLNEAILNLLRNFTNPATDAASAFTALGMALTTWASTRKVAKFKQTKYISKGFRSFMTDYGPTLVILFMSLIGSTPWVRYV